MRDVSELTPLLDGDNDTQSRAVQHPNGSAPAPARGGRLKTLTTV